MAAGDRLSGALYQWKGLEVCLCASSAFVLTGGVRSLSLPSRARATAGASPLAQP